MLMLRSIFTYAALLLVIIIAGCSSGRKVFVEHDYSYETNFKDYSSYTFLECERDTNNLCTEIYEAIRRQMQVRGYKLTAEKPTLLVNYGIFYDNLRYQGYMQPVIKNWVDTENDGFRYEPIKYALDKGTLIVSLIDAESDQVVWRGYASGIFKGVEGSNNHYRSVVRRIFDQYPLFAKGYDPRRYSEAVGR
ncbi:DUF4136 domain-containing protein [Dyadobacter aurulentus]|uniref:DUF4136 domain-containing protein n=1 Tax=Dyadobacter sp. UC 10 TaxID=2605428 RepID=UPI0011F3EFB9|nr:DUF4136 domain-containing protein [Dyadobacter sp. UC 10]KAA0990758.1 DUF4136 domain-containing protein [Dyadobacter sp. UC 10]